MTMSAIATKNAHLGLRPGPAPKPLFDLTATLGPKVRPVSINDADGKTVHGHALTGYSGGRDVTVVVPDQETLVKIRRLLLDCVQIGFTAHDAGVDAQGSQWLLLASTAVTKMGSAPAEDGQQARANATALGLRPTAVAA